MNLAGLVAEEIINKQTDKIHYLDYLKIKQQSDTFLIFMACSVYAPEFVFKHHTLNPTYKTHWIQLCRSISMGVRPHFFGEPRILKTGLVD